MKYTLLATTALVAITSAASAELSISMTGRVGFKTTEGSAVVTGVTLNAGGDAADTALVTAIKAISTNIHQGGVAVDAVLGAVTLNTTNATNDNLVDLDNLIVILERESKNGALSAARVVATTDLASMKALRARLVAPLVTAAAAGKDSTDAVNRVRVSFAGSGETDSGIAYGASIRADNAAAGASATGGTAGSQYISGVFGKFKMGDLDGADKDSTGNIAGVGLTGLSDTNNVTYQSAAHNFGYEYTTAGITLGYSQDTAVKSGSNSALGLKWSGDLGGTSVTVGVGQSKVGVKTQDTVSVSMSTAGLTLKAISSTNDNGAAVALVTKARSTASGTADVFGSAKVNNYETDTTGVSISYSMDAMSVTAFTKSVSTSGVKDMDYSGLGFSYDMGGVSLKAGVVDNNDIQLMDFGVSFSF